MKNIIFLVNISNPSQPDRNLAYDISVESWKRWSSKHDCEVYVLDEQLFSIEYMNPNYYRYYCFQLLDSYGVEYDQVCLVDADTIIHPDCPNFFELTNHEFCAVHNDGDYDWMCRSVENYEYEFYGRQNVDQRYIWSYFNTGFMVTNKNYEFINDIIISFYMNNQLKVQSIQKKYGVGTDQPLVNMLIRNYYNDAGPIPIKLLPYQFNMQDMGRKNILDERMLFTKIPGIYHFNAIEGGPEKVNYWMKWTFEYFYK